MRVLVISDLHYAAEVELGRQGHELKVISNPALRLMAKGFRHWIWLRNPQAHNHRLDQIVSANPDPDWVVANGDFSLDTGFVGVSDPAAYTSAETALGILRGAYGDRVRATMGDHELGKKSLFGGAGGLRLASWGRVVDGLRIPPVWTQEVNHLVMIGAASTPLALPVFLPDALPEERRAWLQVADEVREALIARFSKLSRHQQVLLFVHDPSALPYLARIPEIRERMDQIVCTVIGHLHTPAVFRLGQLLAGFPRVGFCGHSVRRYSTALQEARWWRAFRTVLCPSPTGIQLLKDGGWLEIEIPNTPHGSIQIHRRHLPWVASKPRE